MSQVTIISGDGAPTLFSEEFGESYRSVSGAATESGHIFIHNCLERYTRQFTASGKPVPAVVNVLEYGFGTGLNALLTAAALESGQLAEGMEIRYTTVDKFPLPESICSSLEYRPEGIRNAGKLFMELHSAPWDGSMTGITEGFSIRKILSDFREYDPSAEGQWADAVYFDPFSPASEPECWSTEIFRRAAAAMTPGAVLATYSSKGDVKRALRSAGLTVIRIPGTGMKRHNLIALKDQ